MERNRKIKIKVYGCHDYKTQSRAILTVVGVVNNSSIPNSDVECVPFHSPIINCEEYIQKSGEINPKMRIEIKYATSEEAAELKDGLEKLGLFSEVNISETAYRNDIPTDTPRLTSGGQALLQQ